MTEIVRVDPAHPDDERITRAADCLRRGGLVAFPTETVYGLGAHALDPVAVRRIFEAKGRPASDPLIVHVATFDQAAALAATVPDTARALAARFWPGPLTLVMRKAPAVPPEVTAGLDTVAIRVPAHPVARALLEAARIPVAAPSANLFSRPSPTRAAHVLEDLRDRIDMVLDGGVTHAGIESTVIDLTTAPPVLLRPGAVPLEAVREVVPDVVERRPASDAEAIPKPSPGLLAKHYAPRTPMTLFQGEPGAVTRAMRTAIEEAGVAGRRIGALASTEIAAALEPLPAVVVDLGDARDLPAIAARLYAALRDLDARRLDALVAADVQDDTGLGLAIRDRLKRAAAAVVVVP